MKRLSRILLAISFAVGTLAALSAAAAPLCVTVPQLSSGFILGVAGYYLRPAATNGDLDYVRVNNGACANLAAVRPRYDWGWGINAGYIFCNTGNDVNLSYFQLDTRRDTDSVTSAGFNGVSPAANIFNFPLTDPNSLNPVDDNAVCARTKYDINQVDLTAGQFIQVGCRLRLHPFAGLRWLKLERDLTTRYTQSSTITSTATIVQTQNTAFMERSRLQGIGPLAGVDARYCVACGFGLVGHFDTGLLMGSGHASTHELVEQIIAIPGIVSDSVLNTTDFNSPSDKRIVPVMEMKLGGAYTFIFNRHCPCNSALTFEAGWMFSHYFNAVDRLHTATVLQNAGEGGESNTSILSPIVTGNCVSDVSLNGPYISLVFHV